MEKRESINQYNIYIRSCYYFVHYSSVFTTTFALGYVGGIDCNDPAIIIVKELIWIGICLNMVSTVLSSIEQMNKNISKKMLKDIINIKNGNYIDEGDTIGLSHKNSDSKIYVENT
jgi:O-antigen/teichoic acid export membrane protein